MITAWQTAPRRGALAVGFTSPATCAGRAAGVEVEAAELSLIYV
ncbi:hypothetical protein [Sorangium sp. So ce1151]